MKYILYITYDGLTDPLGQSQILPYVTGLVEYGYKFVILSCEKKVAYEENKDIIYDIVNTHKISWEPILYTKQPPILSTLFDYWKLKIKAILLQKKYNFSLVHCRSYIPSMIGLHLKNKYNVKFLFDMRGFWADERVDGELWDRKKFIFNYIYLFFKKQEKCFLKNADHVISLTHSGLKEIRSWNYTKEELPASVIPCCVDTDLFNRDTVSYYEVNNKRNELGFNENDFIISYLGSIGTWYLLDEMLNFFKIYLSKNLNAKLLFITKDSCEMIKSRCKLVGVDSKYVVIVSSDRKSVPIYLALSKFSIFFIKPAYSKISSSPTKQGELMAMGIPVICNAGVGDTAWIVNNYKSGLVVDDFSETSYINLTKKMSNYNFGEDELRNGAIEYFSLDKGVREYAKIYDNIC